MDSQRICHYLVGFLHTPIRIFDAGGRQTAVYFDNGEQPELIARDEGFCRQLLTMGRSSRPTLHVEGEQILYGVVTAGETACVVGPCCLRDSIAAAAYLQRRHGLTSKALYRVPKISMEIFTNAVLMLFESLTGQELDPSSLWLGSFCDADLIQDMNRTCQQVIFSYQEENLPHNPYSQEQREQDAIRTGDLDALEASFREVYLGKVGTLSGSPLRHTKNLAIVLITLACRSAIAGGLLPEIAFSMSDAFIQRAEALRSEGKVVALARQAEIEYCQRVRALKGGGSRNPLVSHCKELVFQHLHGKFEVREAAEALGVNANYLSQLFNREEGLPLKDYIAREKIVYSKHQLIYTDASFDDIAATLGFASQSHFGRVFKKWAGMTPGQYRLRYGRDGAGGGSDSDQDVL